MRVLRHLLAFRHMSREQIEQLEFTPSTSSACKRRLTLLYHNGYVGRLALPLRNAYGATKAVYFLERRGFQLLRDVDGLSQRFSPPRADDRSELFLHHSLDISEVRVAFTLASRRHSVRLAWWHEDDLRLAKLQVTNSADPRAHFVPDAFLVLSGPNWSDGFILEVDRGTVSPERMRQRFASYGQWIASGAASSRLGQSSLRVLTVITDPGRDRNRLSHLKSAAEEASGGSLFWFTNHLGLQVDIVASPVWMIAGQQSSSQLRLSGALTT